MKQSEQQSILLNKLSFLEQPYFSVLKYAQSILICLGGGGGRTRKDSESQNLSYPLKVIVAMNFLKKC